MRCPTQKASKILLSASVVFSDLFERHYLSPPLLRRVGRFRLGCGYFHGADFLRCTSLHLVRDAHIGIQGEPGAEVAQRAEQGLTSPPLKRAMVEKACLIHGTQFSILIALFLDFLR